MTSVLSVWSDVKDNSIDLDQSKSENTNMRQDKYTSYHPYTVILFVP